MILRLRPVLTILLLLLFSLENVANGAMDVCSEKNQTRHHFSAQKENLTLFSYLIEENESEERDEQNNKWNEDSCKPDAKNKDEVNKECNH